MKHNYKTAFCSMRNMFGRSTSPTRKMRNSVPFLNSLPCAFYFTILSLYIISAEIMLTTIVIKISVPTANDGAKQ